MTEMSDDLLLICLIQDFLEEFRSVAAYPDLVSMTYAEFERSDPCERGRIFEAALGRYIEKRTRQFKLITGAGTLDFGLGLVTASGIRHEIDLVFSNGTTLYAFEAKHYFDSEVSKDMLAVFNQKTLDFYLELLRKGLPISMKRVFVARTAMFNFKVREFAWSWGVALLGGSQRHPLWLQHQLGHWLDSRGQSAELAEYLALANELVPYSMQDLADLIAPFSSQQATLRLGQFLGSERCERLVEDHERLNNYWLGQRQMGARPELEKICRH